tara:strand:- start:104 stop:442 length:339 start_codon:yes stop_codon:yes gene_type:complete
MKKKTTTKKALVKKLLSKNDTNQIYRNINSVAYHLANETSNAPSDTKARKKKFFELQRAIRNMMLSYDSEKKRATLIADTSKLDTWLKAKSIPSIFSKVKTKAKPKSNTPRI